MIEPKKGYIVSKHANLGPPLVLMRPRKGESAEHFAEQFYKAAVKALKKRERGVKITSEITFIPTEQPGMRKFYGGKKTL